MMKKIVEKTTQLGGRDFTLTYGKLAQQADSAVLAKYGETVVLAAVTSREMTEDPGYFPLSVEYQERLYAGGVIKGSRWVKREGRPTDEEVLTARIIDRSIRPLFPDNYNKDVQVIATVLSVDMANDPRIVAANAVSAALATSKIPWEGPISVLNIGLNGGFITNPLTEEEGESQMELVVSNTKGAIVMVESGAKEVSEADILGGIEHAQNESKVLLKLIDDLAKDVRVQKEALVEKKYPAELVKQIKKLVEPQLPGIVERMAAPARGRSTEMAELIGAVAEQVSEEDAPFVPDIVGKIEKEYVRGIIMKGTRPDGRKHEDIRQLSSEVGVLPRTHGSAIFNRGETQVVTIATLGAPSLGQLIETAEGEEEKRYMHHYVMPPYSVGETGRVGGAGRREIGHGALAERALFPVIPQEEDFPYAIRLVSEVTSSNGSTSMASTCGSTLALMDAGVPISFPVSGIAMGLIIDGKKTAILSDIAGIEDFNGDMDFKVAGTEKGITALQLDVKTLNLTLPILKSALAQAKKGRAEILSSMLSTIKAPRSTVSAHAPKIKNISIPGDKIGEVVGPGGRTIKGLIEKFGVLIDISDDGNVNVSGVSEEAVDQAIETIKNMTKEVIPGELYEGEVVRIENFGAFVNFLPGRDGLVHVSDMSEEFVKDPQDIVKMGDKVHVRVKEVDKMGRINLSMLLDPSKDREKEDRPRNDRRRDDRRGRRGDDRYGAHRGARNDRRGPGSGRGGHRDREGGGPHFPTSRLVGGTGSKYSR